MQAALQDWRRLCSSAGVGLADFRKEPPFRPPSLVLEADPPLHSRTRPVLAAALSPARLKAIRPQLVAEAEALVDALVARGSFDAVTDLAEPFPLKAFADALGLPEDGREHLLPYGSMVFNAFGPRNALFEAAVAGSEPVRAWIAAQCTRAAVRPGSIGAAVFEGADRGEVSEEEAGLLMRSLLTAGLDTTVHGIANAVVCLSADPEQWALLRDDPTLARNAFEETLRFESPVQTFFRTTTEAVELGGVRLGEGEKILLFLGGANRDPHRWEAPDRFDLRRKVQGNLAFGYGIHGCVGQVVARMEVEIVLTAMAERVQTIAPVGPPVPMLNNTLKGYSSAPVRVIARG